MNPIPSLTARHATLLCAAILGLAISARAQTFTFGSDNDGLAGFTQSPDNFYGGYTTNATNVQWYQQATNDQNGGPGTDIDGDNNNNSLLRSFTLDRSVGSSYTITGTMNWAAEAERFSRQGIYLFGNSSIIPDELEAGALSLQYQAEAGELRIVEGLNGSNWSTGAPAEDATGSNDVFDSPLIFEAVISFVDNAGTDFIDIDFTLFNDFDGDTTFESDTISHSVQADLYTGDFFGFAGRLRMDNPANPSTTQYQSFAIIPEPSTFALLGLAGLAAFCFRRRR